MGQGPTALAVGAGGGCLDIFTLIYPFSPLSPSLREMARYRLKYCLKGPLNPRNQPKNASTLEDLFTQAETWLSFTTSLLSNVMNTLQKQRKFVTVNCQIKYSTRNLISQSKFFPLRVDSMAKCCLIQIF